MPRCHDTGAASTRRTAWQARSASSGRAAERLQQCVQTARGVVSGGEWRPSPARAPDGLWPGSDGHGGNHAVVPRNHPARILGRGFHPHAFRHALVTTAALRCPEQPGLGAAVLGITATVAERHYNRAGQMRASRALAALIDRHTAGTPPVRPAATHD